MVHSFAAISEIMITEKDSPWIYYGLCHRTKVQTLGGAITASVSHNIIVCKTFIALYNYSIPCDKICKFSERLFCIQNTVKITQQSETKLITILLSSPLLN